MNYIDRFMLFKKSKKDLSYILTLDTYMLTDIYMSIVEELYKREDFNDIRDMIITYNILRKRLIELNVIKEEGNNV